MPLVLQVKQAQQVLLVLWVKLVLQELPEVSAKQAQQVLLEKLVLQALQAKRVRLVLWVKQVLPVQRVKQVRQAL